MDLWGSHFSEILRCNYNTAYDIVENYSSVLPTLQGFCPEYCQLNTMPLDQGKNQRNHTNFKRQPSLLPIKNQSKLPKNPHLHPIPKKPPPTVTHMQLCCVNDRFFRPFRSASCTSLKVLIARLCCHGKWCKSPSYTTEIARLNTGFLSTCRIRPLFLFKIHDLGHPT